MGHTYKIQRLIGTRITVPVEIKRIAAATDMRQRI